MAGNILLKAGSTITCVSSGSAISAGYVEAANNTANLTNDVALDEYVTACLQCDFSTSPTQGLSISLYLVPIISSNSGSVITGALGSGAFISQSYLVGNFNVVGDSGNNDIYYVTGIPLEAYDYVPYLVNNADQTIPSGWSLVFTGSQHQYT
jgi:hypothetical protein